MQRFRHSNFITKLGGKAHSGWLPDNGGEPLPLPVRELSIDFVIEGTEDGYIFKYYSHDGEMMGDNWFEFLEDAKTQAQFKFGVPLDAWIEEKP